MFGFVSPLKPSLNGASIVFGFDLTCVGQLGTLRISGEEQMGHRMKRHGTPSGVVRQELAVLHRTTTGVAVAEETRSEQSTLLRARNPSPFATSEWPRQRRVPRWRPGQTS